jgi:hypothetical protein
VHPQNNLVNFVIWDVRNFSKPYAGLGQLCF